MNGFLAALLPFNIPLLIDSLGAVSTLVQAGNLYFWLLIVFPLARFQLPLFCLWAMHLWRPVTQARANTINADYPLVSVLIAGRNESETIHSTITSVLRCGYPNLEVVFVDDCSDDDTLTRARWFEQTGKVRTFGSRDRNGKPSSLNIGIDMVKGDYVFILDADTEVQYGAIHELMKCMDSPEVGAVTGNIRVRNPDVSLVSRLQELEYGLNVSVSRFWRAELGILSIIAGAAGLFRTEALKQFRGFDTGLGDDTDMTIKLRKLHWKLRFAPMAVVWTNVPTTWRALFRQRARWERNMVKIRLRKHGDLLLFWRYGPLNAIMLLDNFIVRIGMPMLYSFGLVAMMFSRPFSTPVILTQFYWIAAFFALLKLLIAHDLVATPRLRHIWLAIIFPAYRTALRAILITAILREALRIRIKHGYVPDKIWNQTRHW